MIYTRIDTYSVILYGTSINSVLRLFNLPSDELNKAFESYSANDVGMGSTFVFKTNGIRFDCKKDEYDFKTSNADVKCIFDIYWSEYMPSRDNCFFKLATPSATTAVTTDVCSMYSGILLV